jgi:RNA polymerase sigma-54 factor
MALKLEQKISQKQQASKSPQLIKAIGLLEKTNLEIQNIINEEIQTNPILEEWSSEDDDKDVGIEEKNEPEIDSTTDVSSEGEVDKEIDWGSYDRNDKTGWPKHIDQEKNLLPHERASSTMTQGLFFHLMRQLNLSKMNVVQKEIGTYIIGNLDEDGFLEISIEEICQDIGYLSDTVRETLELIQKFDPSGVAARNLKECLLIQVRSKRLKRSLVEIIIEEHFEKVKNKKCGEISKNLSVPISDVNSAVLVIFDLDHRPGRRYSKISGEYSFALNYSALHIEPEVYVYRDGDDYRIELKDDFIPAKINPDYYELLSNDRLLTMDERKVEKNPIYRKILKNNGKLTDEDRQYLQDKFKKAQFFVKSLYKRQETIRGVTKSIVRFQKDFFDTGLITRLKPLIYRQVAEDIEMNETTVGRVCRTIYVDTPHGLFSLKFFFDKESFETLDGVKVVSKSVKAMIREIIQSEKKEKPFRDQEISAILKTDFKIHVDRRTVMKYRDAMRFLSARLRKWPC